MIEHVIDGVTYRLHADGGLDLADEHGQRVALAPGVMFGLSVFMKWPGIRPMLTEAEKERQRCQSEGADGR